MIINNKKYHIKEIIYKDGHTEYIAQYAINCLFFNIWKNYIVRSDNYPGGVVNYLCCGETYTECNDLLNKTIKEKEKERNAKTIDKINYFF